MRTPETRNPTEMQDISPVYVGLDDENRSVREAAYQDIRAALDGVSDIKSLDSHDPETWAAIARFANDMRLGTDPSQYENAIKRLETVADLTADGGPVRDPYIIDFMNDTFAILDGLKKDMQARVAEVKRMEADPNYRYTKRSDMLRMQWEGEKRELEQSKETARERQRELEMRIRRQDQERSVMETDGSPAGIGNRDARLIARGDNVSVPTEGQRLNDVNYWKGLAEGLSDSPVLRDKVASIARALESGRTVGDIFDQIVQLNNDIKNFTPEQKTINANFSGENRGVVKEKSKEGTKVFPDNWSSDYANATWWRQWENFLYQTGKLEAASAAGLIAEGVESGFPDTNMQRLLERFNTAGGSEIRDYNSDDTDAEQSTRETQDQYRRAA